MTILKRAKKRRIITLIWCIVIEIIIFGGIFFAGLAGTTEKITFTKILILFSYWMGPVLLFTIIIFITCFTNLYTRSFNKYIENMSKEQLEQFNREIDTGYRLDKNIFTSNALVIPSGLFLKVVPLEKLVWVYLGGPYTLGATVIQIYFVTADKKRARGYINRKTKVCELDEFMRLIKEKKENVLTGYLPEYKKLYKKDFKEMVRRANQNEFGGEFDKKK